MRKTPVSGFPRALLSLAGETNCTDLTNQNGEIFSCLLVYENSCLLVYEIIRILVYEIELALRARSI